jgi:predicted amidohydrolase YtcJ
MHKSLALIALSLLSSVACSTTDPASKTSMTPPPREKRLFIGGTVLAGPEQTPRANTAILVVGGRVAQIGPADVLRRANPDAKLIDASSATILPGLTDAHAHLYGLGLSLDSVNLVGAESYEEVIRRVRARAATARPGEWILGRGWDQNRWSGKQFPTAAALDAAILDHPVWLRRVDGHAGLANSAALKAANVTSSTADPEGGRVLRDSAGNPTGVFVDEGMELIDRAVPAPSHELRRERVRKAAEAIAATGLTEVHDAGIDAETIAAVHELIDAGQFPIRLYAMLGDDKALLEKWFKMPPEIGYGAHLTIRSVKLYADGALGSRGAALLQPYSDDPSNRGLLISRPEHIEDVARHALAAGYQVNTHAIGDRGVRNVIDAYEKAGAKEANRFRIEHLQIIAPEDMPRLSKIGIIASMQPTHATSDMPWAEDRLGPERIKGAYAWRSVLSSGARLALGSDFPVEAVNPFFGIYSAVTRQDQAGQPPTGWYPEQRLTLPEAIRGFTYDAAYAAFEEESRGTIEPGKLADFTIIEQNPYDVAPSQLFKMKVKYTVVGGEIVYPERHPEER